MNKLLTFPGQMPVYLGDLDYMNQTVRDTFLQLLKGLTGQERPTCILSGAISTGYEVTEGVVVLDGEILPSRAVSSSDYIKDYYYYGFNVETIYSGGRTFKDGSYHDCYESRIAVPVVDPNAAVKYPLRDDAANLLIPEFSQLLTRVMKSDVLAGDSVKTTGNITRSVQIIRQGNLFICRGTLKINATVSDVSELWKDSGMYAAGLSGFINEGVTLIPIVVDTGGYMEIIPGKLTITKNSDGKTFEAILTITTRDFTGGTMLSLSSYINTI